MDKWFGKFSLLLKRLKDAWMDMLPLSTMSEEQRQNPYLADVTQENAERPKEGVRKFWIRAHKRLETDGMLHR